MQQRAVDSRRRPRHKNGRLEERAPRPSSRRADRRTGGQVDKWPGRQAVCASLRARTARSCWAPRAQPAVERCDTTRHRQGRPPAGPSRAPASGLGCGQAVARRKGIPGPGRNPSSRGTAGVLVLAYPCLFLSSLAGFLSLFFICSFRLPGKASKRDFFFVSAAYFSAFLPV